MAHTHEYMDVVDENDEVVGRATQQDVYKKLLRHRIAHVFVYNEHGEILLQKRSKLTSFCPLCWSTSVGGHVQEGETGEEAALREGIEETGVTFSLTFLGKEYYHVEGRPDKFLYVYKAIHNGPFSTEDKNVESFQFCTVDEIKNKIQNGEAFHPELIFLLERYVFK